MAATLRIAMWCVPRTVSTALMRSFANRDDCTCVDEPLYAHYLAHTGRRHPLQDEVLAAQHSDWRQVVDEVLLGPCATPVHFAKHMCHHMAGVDPGFAAQCLNAFLIRDPHEMLASFVNDLDTIEFADTGYGQQAELYRRMRADSDRAPVVIDSKDLLQDPEGMLRAFCGHAGIDFQPAMLSWEAGRHPSFGVWAPHWYRNVERSTGFAPWRPKSAPFPEVMRPHLERALPLFEELHAQRLQPSAAG